MLPKLENLTDEDIKKHTKMLDKPFVMVGDFLELIWNLIKIIPAFIFLFIIVVVIIAVIKWAFSIVF